MNIGFIGLGNMGRGMALNLVKANHKVKVYDINIDAVNDLNSHGCIGCSNIKLLYSFDWVGLGIYCILSGS